MPRAGAGTNITTPINIQETLAKAIGEHKKPPVNIVANQKLDWSERLWRYYGRVFVGYNGAQSYYAARAFRGVLRV
jgi:hypothetical protein